MNQQIKQGLKKLPIVLLAILFTLAFLSLTACNEVDVAELKVVESTVPQNVKISEFDITKITLTIIDSNGASSSLPATANMLTTESKNALKEAGEHEITLYYQKKTVSFKVTLFADDAELVTVTFNDKSGNKISSVTVPKGDEVTAPEHPVVEGYTADGWKDSTGAEVDLSAVETDIIAIANYEKNLTKYTVTFKDYDGKTVETMSVESGGKLPGVASYRQPAGISSYSWYYGNSELNINSLVVTSNIVITMKVEYVKYTVTYRFLKTDGTYQNIGTESVPHGETAGLATTMARKLADYGYNFNSWNESYANITSDRTITAKAAIKTYTVRFIDYNGDVMATHTVTHGASAFDYAPTNPTVKTGYNFKQWSKNFTNIKEDLDVEAIYSPKPISAYVQIGANRNPITIYYDSVIDFVDVTEGSVTEKKLSIISSFDNSVTPLQGLEDSIFLGLYSSDTFDASAVYSLPLKINFLDSARIFYAKLVNTIVGSPDLSYETVTGEDESYALVSAYTGSDTIIYIPDSHGQLEVRGIKDDVFNAKNVAAVYFGKNIETIGARAFSNTALSGDIELPEGITTIGDRAFYQANELVSVILPSTLVSLATRAFESCEKLESVVFKNVVAPSNAVEDEGGATPVATLDEIKADTFKDCAKLVSVVLPSTVKTIGENAFNACVALTTINLNAVTAVGNNAFVNTEELVNVGSLAALTTIGENAFYGSGLTSAELTAVTSIGAAAFMQCIDLVRVNVGSKLTAIPAHCFDSCGKLTSIVFATAAIASTEPIEYEGVQTFGADAFIGCNAMTSITFPRTIVFASPEAIATAGLYSLTKIKSFGMEDGSAFFAEDGVLFKNEGEGEAATVSLFAYPAALAANEYVVPANVTTVLNGSFRYALVGRVAFADTIVTIERGAFVDSRVAAFKFAGEPIADLEAVVPSSVVKIFVPEAQAEAYSALTEIASKVVEVTAETVIADEYDANSGLFYVEVGGNITITGADRSKTSIVVPDTIATKKVTAIAIAAFANCDVLASIIIGGTIAAIGDDAFTGCVNLQSIVFNDVHDNVVIGTDVFSDTPWYKNQSLIVIGDIAFEFKSVMNEEGEAEYPEELIIPNGVTKLVDELFKDSVLVSVTLPSTLETIGEKAFFNSRITSISIPASVNKIGAFAFSQCAALETADLSTSRIKDMEASTFASSVELKTVLLPASLEIVGAEAFAGCLKLENLRLPSAVKTVGEKAFFQTNLYSINLPATVTEIGANAFAECASLVAINVFKTEPCTIGATVFPIGAKIYVPNSENSAVKAAYVSAWSDYATAIVEEKNLPTATFVTNLINGDTETELNAVPAVSKVTATVLTTLPQIENIDGYVFLGWCIDEEATDYVTLPYALDRDVILYAKWVKDDVGTLHQAGVTMLYYSDYNGYGVSTYSAQDSKVYIPAFFDGADGRYPVVRIDANAFNNNDSITEIIFAANANVNYIGERAFYGCDLIETIELPAGVKYVGNEAFASMPVLSLVKLPSAVTAVGDDAFDNSANADIEFGADSKLIYASVNSFDGSKWYADAVAEDGSFIIAGSLLIEYTGVEELIVTIPSNVVSIADGVFEGETYIETVEIHNNVEYIGANAFKNASNITTFDFGELGKSGVSFIGENAFLGTKWLNAQGDIVVAGNILKKYVIADDVEEAVNIVLPDYIQYIDADAFSYQTLKTIKLPDGLLEIGDGAFLDCNRLESVVIPASVIKIGANAFKNCVELKAVYFEKNSKLTEIGEHAFDGCVSLGSAADALTLALPASVEKLGVAAFSGASALKKVDLSQTKLIEVAQSAFLNCSALEEVKLSSLVVTLGISCFAGCIALESIVVPADSQLTYINEHAVTTTKWYNRTPAEEEDYILIYIGSLLLKFVQKEGLQGDRLIVTVPEVIKHIMPNAFYLGDSSKYAYIENVILPNGLLTIGNGAFRNCAYLTSIVIPDSVTSIGSGAFEDCSELSEVTLGTGLLTIGENAFYDCGNLAKLIVNRTAYGTLTEEQQAALTVAINNLATNPNSIREWLTAQGVDKIATGTKLGSGALVNTHTYLRIYVKDPDGKTTNVEIYKSIWAGYESRIFKEGTYPAITYTPISGSTNLSIMPTEWLTEDILQVVYTEHTLLGWQVLDGVDYTDITLPYRVYTHTTIRAKWFDNNRTLENTLTDTELGYNYIYDSGKKGYYVSTLTNSGIPGDTLIVPAKVNGEAFLGFNTNVFNSSNTAAIKKVIIVDANNLELIDINIFSEFANLEQFILYGNKGKYAVEDGVLYSADKKTLIAYPRARKDADGEPITEYTINGNTETIITRAFVSTALSTLVFPDSLKTVLGNAFITNNELETLVFGANSEIVNVAYGAFNGTKWFTLHQSEFMVLGSYLLAYNGSNSAITIPNTVKTVGEKAFYNNGYNNFYTLTVPASVKRICQGAFEGCSNLVNIIFMAGSNLMEIANGVFDSTGWIEEMSSEADEFVVAGNVLVKYRGASESIIVPSIVKVIGHGAFSNKEFGSITLHSGIVTIEDSAFYACQNLTQITIPKSVIAIGQKAFEDCLMMSRVTFESGSTLKTIGAYAFNNCKSLVEFTLPDNVKAIAAEAFANTSEMSNFVISRTSKLSEIGSGAFKNSRISSIFIPDELTAIAAETFRDCKSLVTVTFSDGNRKLAEIGAFAFYGCSSLGSNLDMQVAKVVDVNATNYSSAPSLMTVVLPNYVTTIGQSAFQNCSGMYGIKIGSVLRSIGDNAFAGCMKLANVTISTGAAPTLGTNAFPGATAGDEYSKIRVYVNKSNDNSTLFSYRGSWQGAVTDESRIVDRGSVPTVVVKTIVTDTTGNQHEVEIARYDSFTISDTVKGNGLEFMTQGSIELWYAPIHPADNTKQFSYFYTNISDAVQSRICTNDVPYYVFQPDESNEIVLYCEWTTVAQ